MYIVINIIRRRSIYIGIIKLVQSYDEGLSYIYIYKLLFYSGWLYLRYGGKTKPTWEQRSHTLGKDWSLALWGAAEYVVVNGVGWKVVYVHVDVKNALKRSRSF
jgi:hypothetical protein